MSSVFNPTETNHREFNAVNNVTICPGGTYTSHSNSDHRPWIRIDLQSEYDVQRVVIFNRQERFGRFVFRVKSLFGEDSKQRTCTYVITHIFIVEMWVCQLFELLKKPISYTCPRYNLFNLLNPITYNDYNTLPLIMILKKGVL